MWNNILFDLDGTLVDSGVGVTNSVKYALEAMGCPLPNAETLRQFIGPPLHFSFMEFAGLDEEQAKEATRLYRVYYEDKGIGENLLYPGIEAMLQRLQTGGKTLFVATSKPTKYAAQILQALSIAHYFKEIAGSTLDYKDSEKPQIIAQLLRKYGIAPDSAVMVGDRHYDIDGAVQNGMASVGVLYGYGSRQELEAAGANYTRQDTAQLAALLLKTN